MQRPAARTLVVGTLIGLLILGVGGRVAMAAIQVHAGGSPSFTLGGTMTVVSLGAASGLAGAVLLLLSRGATARVRKNQPWLARALFAALLLLVTMRGLRGSAEIGRWYFYPLVAVYGAVLALLTRQRQRPSGD